MDNIKKPHALTVAEASTAISNGALSPLELTTSCLEHIAALDERIRAWVLVDRDGAREAAHRLDQELHQGQRRGPLHGIPIGIKDIFYTAGLRTEAGSRFWSGFVPSYDATVVARFKEAGAVILGKTHTTEFAYFDSAPTRNPWNTAHTPGGSSSGSGAAVASGMCLAAIGTQTGGSVLRPAAYNGIVGFKPQHGRLSTYGVVPVSWTLDHVGILARSVEDAAIIFEAIAGYDPKDNHSLNSPVPDCMSPLENQPAPRFGLVRQYFFDHADEEMRHHTEAVVAQLRRAGAEVEDVELPPDFDSVHDICRVIMSVEASTYHQEMFIEHRDEYGPGIRKLIEYGLNVAAIDYTKALQARLQLCADVEPLLQQVDVLLTPGATGPAPRGLATTGSPVMQEPWSVTGLPAISLPTGLSREGLPLAIQLVGPPLAEERLLAVARWCERTLDVSLRPPLD
jgi:aspartyl-tRNA(Asn)/glutamyl-tRNA(Gln) amidotransferase subunit A